MTINLKNRTRWISAVAVLCAVAAAIVGTIAYGTAGKDHPAAHSNLATHVNAKIAKAFPVFDSARASDAAEAQIEANQLPVVAEGIANMQGFGANSQAARGVNAALARAIYTSGTTTVYLVPGNETICHVAVNEDHFAGGACSEASVLERLGSVGYEFTSNGYAVYGILPSGSYNVAVTDTNGTTTNVPVNANGGFVFNTTTPPARLIYSTPAAGQQTIAINAAPTPPTPEG
jgi:hypothetical protein